MPAAAPTTLATLLLNGDGTISLSIPAGVAVDAIKLSHWLECAAYQATSLVTAAIVQGKPITQFTQKNAALFTL